MKKITCIWAFSLVLSVFVVGDAASNLLREIAYDDGSLDNAWAWNDAGNMWAVRFTPTKYPCTLKIAKFGIDEDWPSPGNDNFDVAVYDDDGAGGSPGTLLGGPINSGTMLKAWVNVDVSSMNITITEGDFYIALIQVGNYPDCVGIATDTSSAWAQRSWGRNVQAGGWQQLDASYGNFMIRALVDAGPVGSLVPALVNPTGPIEVETGQTFSFTTEVQCVGGDCENVTATLDPQEENQRGGSIRKYDQAALKRIVPDKSPEERLAEINEKIKEKGARWKAGLTPKALLSVEEKRILLGSYVLPEEDVTNGIWVQADAESLPSAFDWREEGEYEIDWMTSVKDQASCGSCWAFSVLGTVEAAYNIYNNDPDMDLDLSEQQLVSNESPCCGDCGDCGGGNTTYGIGYVHSTGVVDEDCFPYTATNAPCDLCPDWKDRRHYIGEFFRVFPNTQEAYKQALLDYGPLSISIDSSDMFLYYVDGVYEELEDIDYTGVNHAIVLVGWDDAQSCWIIKNSWGTDWGTGGYGKIVYGYVEKYNYVRAVYETNATKGIIPMNSGTPFYTLHQNPADCGDMDPGETCQTTWDVVASGKPGTYEFFVVYESAYGCWRTNKVNVTITGSSRILFADSFEDGEWNGLWFEDGQDDWFRSNAQSSDGSWSAGVDGQARDATLAMANAMDLSDRTIVTLTFSWFIETNWDNGEYICLDIYGGEWHNDIASINGASGTGEEEDHWIEVSMDLDASDFGGTTMPNDSNLRFRASVKPAHGTGYVDNVSISDWVPTLALISGFGAYEDKGQAVVFWETSSESNTAGFYLLRMDKDTGRYVQVNDPRYDAIAKVQKRLLPGLLHSPQGGTYRCVDETAIYGETYSYKLVEVEANGRRRYYGPFTVTIDGQAMDVVGDRGAELALEPMVGSYDRKPHPMPDTRKARLQARKAEAKATTSKPKKPKKVGSVKIGVAEKGLYYLDAGDMAAMMGLPHWRVVDMIGHNELQLSNRGQKVPTISEVRRDSQSTKPTEGNAGIYFYGEGIDSLYTRENVYWLEEGQGIEMELMDGGSPGHASGYETFTEMLHVEEDHHPLTALFHDPESDYWLWDYVVGGYPDMDSKSFTVPSPGAAAAGEAVLAVYLKGVTSTDTSPDHHVVVILNGTEIGESQWDGTANHQFAMQFPQQLLLDGDNTVEVTGVLDTDVPYSIFYVDSFDLSYQRHYHAVGNALFARVDGNPLITIGGFSDPGIMVFEVTYPGYPRLVTGTTLDEVNGSHWVSFVPASPEAVYLALTLDGLRVPASVAADVPSDLDRQTNSADYLVIAPGELKEAAEELALYRQRRFRTMVVELEDIYDEFCCGIASPEAIRSFLSYAYHHWITPPRYVVLAGAGTFDYKDNQGYGDNLVPCKLVNTPHGLFASDNWFADVAVDDGIPEMCMGRLPVLTAGELQAFVNKMMDYEKSRASDWEKRVLMLADNPDDGGDFPADSDDVALLLPADYTLDRVYLSEHTVSEARQLVLDGINNGAVLVNYLGHAGMDRLAQEQLLCITDVPGLSNGGRLPVVTAMTCVAGRFGIPGCDCLSGALVLRADGGAIAAWSPTGFSLNSQAKVLDQEFFRAVFQDGKKVMGEAVLRVLEDYAFSGGELYMLDIYNLLGDPALEIK